MSKFTAAIFYIALAFVTGVQILAGIAAFPGVGPLANGHSWLVRGEPIDPSLGGVDAYLPFVFGVFFVTTAIGPLVGTFMKDHTAVHVSSLPAIGWQCALVVSMYTGHFDRMNVLDQSKRPRHVVRTVHTTMLCCWVLVLALTPRWGKERAAAAAAAAAKHR